MEFKCIGAKSEFRKVTELVVFNTELKPNAGACERVDLHPNARPTWSIDQVEVEWDRAVVNF